MIEIVGTRDAGARGRRGAVPPALGQRGHGAESALHMCLFIGFSSVFCLHLLSAQALE